MKNKNQNENYQIIFIIGMFTFLSIVVISITTISTTPLNYNMECNMGNLKIDVFNNETSLQYLNFSGVENLSCEFSGEVPVYIFNKMLNN